MKETLKINQFWRGTETHNDLRKLFAARGGGGGNFISPWYGVVSFLGYLFMIESGFMGIDFNNFLYFLDLWVRFFVKINLLLGFIGISGFMGMILEISPDLWVVLMAQPRIFKLR